MSPRVPPWFLPLLKSHYNNYSIKSIRRAFLIILLLTIKSTAVQWLYNIFQYVYQESKRSKKKFFFFNLPFALWFGGQAFRCSEVPFEEIFLASSPVCPARPPLQPSCPPVCESPAAWRPAVSCGSAPSSWCRPSALSASWLPAKINQYILMFL